MNKESYYMSANEITTALNSFNYNYNISAANQFIVRNELNEYLASSVNQLVGPVWNDVRTNLNNYSNLLAVSNSVNQMINQTNRECLREILEFLEPDSDLNTADLPKYEQEKDNYITQIESLKTENESLAQVPPTITVYVGEGIDGQPEYAEVANPEYAAAQAKIAANNNLINNELQPELDERNRLIDKINYFNSVVLPNVQTKLDTTESKIDEFLKQVDAQNTSNVNGLKTFFVGATSVLSGIGKVGENLVDGAAWIDGKITTFEYGLTSSLNRLFGQDEIADQIDEYSEAYSRSRAEWIAIDHIDNWNTEFYENTEFGRSINDGSNMKYDSEQAQKIQDTSENVTRIGLEAGATLLTGNPYAATAIGALNNLGETTEETFKGSDDPSLSDGIGSILLSGLEGAAEGNAIAGATTAVADAAKATISIVGKPTGAMNAMEKVIDTTIRKIEDGTMKSELVKGAKDAFLSPSNAIQVAATTADAIANNDLTAGQEIKDVVTEYGYDLLSSAVGTVAPGASAVLDFHDGLSDSGVIDGFDKRIG